jgi:hypothetical protein
MAKPYSLPDKIAAILKKEHGISAQVEDLAKTGEPGIRITVGSYQETLSGVITRDKISSLAARIKEAQ